MNIKRIFGALLTALALGLIYTAVLFMNTAGGNQDISIDNLRNIRTYIHQE
jgi:hypothetical protein